MQCISYKIFYYAIECVNSKTMYSSSRLEINKDHRLRVAVTR